MWRRVCDIKLTYRIDRLLPRNEVETEDFTGIRNFLTDKLEFARLGVSLPPRLREFGWTENDPDDEKLMAVKNAVVTVEARPPIQDKLDDPVNISVMHDNAHICDSTTGRIRIRRPCRANVVFQTVDPLSRELSFTEILSW